MKIALLQTDILWGDPQGNRTRMEDMLRGTDADLVFLPEAFPTGFAAEPDSAAEEFDTATLGWMRSTAARSGAAIGGSIYTRDGGRCRNRFHFVRPDGRCDFYDKRHLFFYGGESDCCTPGDRRVVAEYNGLRILLQICYDLRFPVFARNRGDYDMIVYAANWPASRTGAWDTLLRARAIENQCYVAGVNRVGTDPGVSYDGHSALIDPGGNYIIAPCTGSSGVLAAEIDPREPERFRERFPVLGDADRFTLG